MARDRGASVDRPPPDASHWANVFRGAPEGEPHDAATRLTGHYLAVGLGEEEVESLIDAFASRCTPPFPEREARGIVRDLAAKDRSKAHSVLAPHSVPGPKGPIGSESNFRPLTAAEFLSADILLLT